MNQLLLPRFKRLMEPASWRDLSVGQAWGAVSGLCHGFALLTLLPAASALATGMPVWGVIVLGLAHRLGGDLGSGCRHRVLWHAHRLYRRARIHSRRTPGSR